MQCPQYFEKEKLDYFENRWGSLQDGELNINRLGKSHQHRDAGEIREVLRKSELSPCLIPKSLGGQAQNTLTISYLFRSLARRDLGLATLKAKSILAALPIWLYGNDSQKDLIRREILQGQELSLALTEKNIGSDLSATQTAAVRNNDDYVIRGQKWLINNAELSRLRTVLARTNSDSGLKSFSTFLLPHDPQTRVEHVPLECMPNMRVGSLQLDGVLARQDQLIGSEGMGLEVIFKTLMVSRSFVGHLSLGASETVILLVTEFLKKRKIYGQSALQIPQVRQELARTVANWLKLDALQISTSLLVERAERELPFFSACGKYWIQQETEKIMQSLMRLLGARSFLDDGSVFSLFSRQCRDQRLLGIFDGNSAVNLNLISQSLKQILFQESSAEPSFWQDLYDHGPTDFHWQGRKLPFLMRGSPEIFKTLRAQPQMHPQATEALEGLTQELHLIASADPRSWEKFRLSEKICALVAGAQLDIFIRSSGLVPKTLGEALRSFNADGNALLLQEHETTIINRLESCLETNVNLSFLSGKSLLGLSSLSVS